MALPVAVKVLFVFVAGVVCYGLAKASIAHGIMYHGLAVAAFVVLAFRACKIGHAERVLLKNMRVSFAAVFSVRCMLLSVPFFLLDWTVGILAVTVGSALVVCLSLYQTKYPSKNGFSMFRRLRFKLPFAAAYQWVSGYRTDIVWTMLVGVILHAIAVVHGNRNMACAMMALTVCVPGFTVYYRLQDPKSFLRIFRDSSLLVRRKCMATVLFSAVPLCWLLPVSCIVFTADIWLFVGLTAACIFVNLTMMYACYIFYPDAVLSLVMFSILLILTAVVYSVFSLPVTVCLCAAVLFACHLSAVKRLKNIPL